MEDGNGISLFAALAAGFLTFLSPCLLPLVPAYISYMTGISFNDLRTGDRRRVAARTLFHAALFSIGFSVVFIILGASVTYLGQAVSAYRGVIEKTGGVLVILFGLYMMGILRFGFLDKEFKIRKTMKKGSLAGSLLLGITFAAAWTPCAGPVLGSILILAGTRETLAGGVTLLGMFSLGIAIPFILSALLFNTFLSLFERMKKFIGAVSFIAGILLVFVGILLVIGRFAEFTGRFISFISG